MEGNLLVVFPFISKALVVLIMNSKGDEYVPINGSYISALGRNVDLW